MPSSSARPLVGVVCAVLVALGPPPAPASATAAADLGFTPLPGASASSGVDPSGAAWRVEVPDDWNDVLVVYAHGFVPPDEPDLVVLDPPLRRFFIDHGYAWAASSYRANGYGVVGDAVDDTHGLVAHATAVAGRNPDRVLLLGTSMGGHVVAASLERYPHAYDGALTVCGVLGDTALVDHVHDAALTAAALAGVAGAVPAPPGYLADTVPLLVGRLGLDGSLTPSGHRWGAAVEQLSGGERPLFEEGFRRWATTGGDVDGVPQPATTAGVDEVPFLFALFGGAVTPEIADPRLAVYDNTRTTYRLDGRPSSSPAEARLNADVTRVEAVPGAEPEVPVIAGRPQVPVLALHGLGDLFVPFSMTQVYARRAAAEGRADLFVARAIRSVGHCDVTSDELVTAFLDLTGWVDARERGLPARPAGDPVLDRGAVAARWFGCRFTSEDRPGLPPCPAEAATSRLAGPDRVATAVALSRAAHAHADRVIVARSDLPADALTAAPLAGGRAPVLLTPTDRLADVVADEVARLGADEVVLLGGDAALSAEVEREAAALSGVVRVRRIAGPDRNATAARAALEIHREDAAIPEVFVVDAPTSVGGGRWADATAVSALAAFLGAPVLPVTGDAVPRATADVLAVLAPERITVVGGREAVADGVLDELRALGDATVTRLGGADRYATSALLAERGLASGMSLQRPVVVTGASGADTVSAGPTAAADGQALLLVDGHGLGTSTATTALLRDRAGRVEVLRVAGGRRAVDGIAEQRLLEAVRPPPTR